MGLVQTGTCTPAELARHMQLWSLGQVAERKVVRSASDVLGPSSKDMCVTLSVDAQACLGLLPRWNFIANCRAPLLLFTN